MVCPKCRSRAIGRIGQNQFYCWDCNIEFIPTRDGFRMYRLEPDGTTILDSLDSTTGIDTLTGTPVAEMTDGVVSDSGSAFGIDRPLQDKDPV